MSATFLRKQPSSNRTRSWWTSIGQLRTSLLDLWTGPTDYPPSVRLERRFIALRYLGISFLGPTLPLLNLSTSRLLAAYTLLLVYLSFNLWVHVLLQRRSSWLNHGYITSVGDGLIISVMVMIGGGFASPFYILLFPTTVAAAMRFGYGPSLLVVAFYILLDGISIRLTGGAMPGDRGAFLFRSGYLTLTALLSSYLWEQARVAETALAQQLSRARALNDSSRALNTSLQLDIVARTVAEEVRQLVAADVAMLKLGQDHGELVTFGHATELSGAQKQTQEQALTELLAELQTSSAEDGVCEVSACGLAYIIVPLLNRSRATSWVIVGRAPGHQPYNEQDVELLRSFIERASLAIENASLYKTIGDRSKDLQRAYADLASAHQELLGVDEMKTSFIANVSHELRTPLTSIRAFSEILLTMEVDPGTTQEFLVTINTESERLTRLINDVLDITKIEAGYIEWHMNDLDLADLLSTSARTFTSLLEEKGLQLELKLPPALGLVRANDDRIMQVLANLIGNALKFTTAGAVTLAAEVHDGNIHVHVTDTGIGIAPEDQDRIFDKFHQVGDTLTDKPKGTGLGLCICREIVTHHGGKMWVTSALGQGSTFSFSLPRVAPREEVPTASIMGTKGA